MIDDFDAEEIQKMFCQSPQPESLLGTFPVDTGHPISQIWLRRAWRTLFLFQNSLAALRYSLYSSCWPGFCPLPWRAAQMMTPISSQSRYGLVTGDHFQSVVSQKVMNDSPEQVEETHYVHTAGKGL